MLEKSDRSLPISNPVGSDTEISHTVTEQDKLELMLIIYYLYQQMHTHTHTHTYIYIYILNYITSDQHTRRTKTGLPNCICSHYHILLTEQIVSYNDLQFYVILIILMFYNFSKRNIKAP